MMLGKPCNAIGLFVSTILVANLATVAEPPAAPPMVGYSVAAQNAAGQSLVTQKSVSTVRAALEATFPDLAGFFGERPAIGSAYESAADHNSGGATFTTKWNGQPVRGIVSCRIDGAAAHVAVVFCKSGATKAQWDELTNPQAAQGAGAQANAAAPSGDGEVYKFPDGTGTITLPAGWKTQAQSAISPITLQGPDQESAWIGTGAIVNTPDSPTVKMIQSNQATMRRMGGNPPPPPQMFIAEYTDPVQALKDITPQMSKMNEARGGFAVHLDQVISQKEVDAPPRGGKSAIVVCQVTRTINGAPVVFRNAQHVTITPMAQGTWSLLTTGYATPVDLFERDGPKILAAINSETINQEVASQRMQEINQQQMNAIRQQGEAAQAQLEANHNQFMADQQRRFDQGQAAHAEQMRGYDQHNQQFRDDQLQKSRNNADFVETIRGTRTVYDTQTGTAAQADLTSAGAVVDELNRATLDPNRFVQIPLRDEMYPVPAGK